MHTAVGETIRGRVSPWFRPACLLAALLFGALAVGLAAPWPALAGAWPWPEARMSFVFLSAIAASVAAVAAAAGLAGEPAALSGLGLNAAVTGLGGSLAIVLGQSAPAGPALTGATTLLLVMALAAVLGLALLAWALRQALHDARRTPPALRVACAVFGALLVAVGARLVLHAQVFPWVLQPGTARMFGTVFLGAGAYFLFGAAQRRWAHAAALMWGLLAYDLTLLLPYARMLGGDAGGTAPPDDYGDAGALNVSNLVVYLAALGLSTLMALYVLLLHPGTRLWRRRSH